jgi:hypothetical protein
MKDSLCGINITHRYVRLGLFVVCFVCIAPYAFGAVMQSASYRMNADSVNVGGIYGESSTYHMEDTVGEMATGDSASATYSLHAGYQQMHGSMISMTPGADITLTALSMAQNSAVGSTSWTVITDDASGYALSVHASASPALVDAVTSEAFMDYSEVISGTPETWSVTSAYEFGFSGHGTDVGVVTWGSDAQSNCIDAADTPSSGLKWIGFDGLNDILLASSEDRTSVSGTATYMCVATEQDSVFAPSGSYTATVTATAVAQ